MTTKKIIRARAPLRLGLAGGGTDVSPYCDKFGGLVVNASIDRYAYTIIRPLDENKVRLVSRDHNIQIEKNFNKLFPDNEFLFLHKVVYEYMIKNYNDNKDVNIECNTFCDAPPGSGLGSSSTVVVTMIMAFLKYFNVQIEKYDIANLAYEIERNYCKFKGGKQDHYSAVFGGFNYMEFFKDGNVKVNPIELDNWVLSELEASLLLFYTGISRDSNSIISEQIKNVELNNIESIQSMHLIKQEANFMKDYLIDANFIGFIDSLQIGWKNKKKIAKNITNEHLDFIYESAISAGALAGKISGAGGGGFFIFFVPAENRMKVIRKLDQFKGQISNCNFTLKGAEVWEIE